MRLFVLVIAMFLCLSACSPETRVSMQESKKSYLGFDNKFVSVNGLTFRYIEKGSGELVLFLHGFPYFSEAWYKIIDNLQGDYRAIAPDNRGYGYSDKPQAATEYHIEKLVSDVLGLINALSPNKKVVIVGHDWGAGLAWTTAQLYPERVSKLVLINGVALNVFLKVLQRSEIQRERSKYIHKLDGWLARTLFAIRGPELLWEGIEEKHKNGLVNDIFKEAYLNAWEQPNAAQSAVKWYRANIPEFDQINEDDMWPSADARVDVPALLIWSKGDPAFSDDVFKLIPNYINDLEIKIVDTDEHAPFLSHSEQVSAYIQQFLAQ